MNTPPKFDDNLPFNFLDDPSDLTSQESNYFKESLHFAEDKIDKIVILDASSKSRNFTDLQFTNFLSGKECKEYDVLQKIYNEWKNGIDIINRFESVIIEDRNQEKLKRLCAIISRHKKRKCYLKCKNNEKCLNRNILKTIEHKYKDKQCNVPLRVFAKKIKNIVYVCLLDFYHLGMPAFNKATGKTNIDGLYKAICQRQFCMSNIINSKNFADREFNSLEINKI
jgi:hypothetical protein